MNRRQVSRREFLGRSALLGGGALAASLAARPARAAGQIVITELMHNTTTISDDAGEWIEVYNPSPTVTYDLFGCDVSDTSPPGNTIDVNLWPSGSGTGSRRTSSGTSRSWPTT